MAVFKDIYDCDLPPPHPGEILREDVLPHLRLKRAVLARRLKWRAQDLAELLSERRSINQEMAVQLAAAFGQSARFWLGLQAQHDGWRSRQIARAAYSAMS